MNPQPTNIRDERSADVVVVGAGLAGLAAGAAAAAAGPDRRVVVLDTRVAGGRARTDEHDGFRFNQGAHALYRGGAGRQVLRRLGVTVSGRPPVLDDACALRDAELFVLPTGARRLMTTRLLGARGKSQIGALLSRLSRIDTTAMAGLTTNQWLDSLRLRPDARGLVATLVRVGTYAADFDTCSADAAARQLQMAVADGVDYLDGGWQSIVDGLADVATRAGAEIRTGERVLGLGRDGDSGPWTVTTAAGELGASTVVLAAGSPAAAIDLLPDDPGWSLGPDTTAACLDLGLRHRPRPGVIFGVDRPLYLSTHCPPAELAPDGQVVVHLMRYGARTAAADRGELWTLAARAGIAEADVVTQRFLHRMVVAHAMPIPGRGLAGRPAVAVANQTGAFVAGDWVGPDGMLGDASLASGEAAGRAAVESLRRSVAMA
jgi:phytoene dehydrogenase-like protein